MSSSLVSQSAHSSRAALGGHPSLLSIHGVDYICTADPGRAGGAAHGGHHTLTTGNAMNKAIALQNAVANYSSSSADPGRAGGAAHGGHYTLRPQTGERAAQGGGDGRHQGHRLWVRLLGEPDRLLLHPEPLLPLPRGSRSFALPCLDLRRAPLWCRDSTSLAAVFVSLVRLKASVLSLAVGRLCLERM